MGPKYKSLIKKMLLQSGILGSMVKMSKTRIVILKYHSVQETPNDYADSIGPGIIHSIRAFEKQMEIVSRDYNPVILDDVLSFLQGEKKLPRKSVAVTFDDGFADNFTFASPILDRYGIRASFFITVNSVGGAPSPWFCRLNHAFANTRKKTLFDAVDGHERDLSNQAELRKAFRTACKRCACLSEEEQSEAVTSIEKELGFETVSAQNGLMMNWNQIRWLRNSGHTVGSHTLSHPNLAYLKKPQILREMSESKRILEEQLGGSVLHFSYPGPILNPHYNQETIYLTRKAGYRTAVTSEPGPVSMGDDPLSLRRLAIPPEEWEFRWSLENVFLDRVL